MKIYIKTTLIELTAEDAVVHGNDSWTKHSLPDIREAVKSIVNQAINLHNAVVEAYPKKQ